MFSNYVKGARIGTNLCKDCKKPFVAHENIFTQAGFQDIRITGICEKCFDSYFEGDEDAE